MIEWSTLKRLIWLHMVTGGSSGTVTTVTGASPLALANALAKPIKSLIQYGKVVTVDGELYCNNGKLTAVDDELPSGYKRITGIKFDGDFWYNTNEPLTGDDEVTMTLANTAATGQNVFGSYNGTSGGAKNFSLFIYGGGSTYGSYFRYGEQLLRPKFGGNERTITFGQSGTSGFATDVTATPETFETEAPAYIGTLPNNSSSAYSGSIMGSITVGTRLKWIPCERESDGVIGYYEKFNGNFIAPSGSGTPVSLGYDTSHLTVLSVVGTPEVLIIGEDTASGTIASFVPDATIPDLLGVSVAVEPVQAGSGDPSPDNVRPISGWDAVGIYVTGVNVWDGEWETGGIDDNTGEKINVSTQKRSKNYISVAPDTEYYMNTPGLGIAGAFAYAYDANLGFIGRIRIGSAVHLENLAFTTPANCHYILFKIGSSSYDTAQISINYPSTDHDYHPFAGNTYTIQLGETVYGCKLTISEDGSVTALVDRAIYDYGSGTVLPVNNSEDSRAQGLFSAYGFTPPVKTVSTASATETPNIISTTFKAAPNYKLLAPGRNPENATFGQYSGSFFVQWDALAGKSNAEAKALLTGVKIVAPIATPVEIQIDPVTIATISGQPNNVWADAGDVTVTYAPTGVVQTASVVNLFAAGDVKDEQDIISGTVTRRTEVSVVGGVITVSALAEPVTESVARQPMRTAGGNNTIAVTSAVAPVELSVTYYTA